MSGLKKSLGMFDIIALAFGAMVGWGWVVLTPAVNPVDLNLGDFNYAA